MITTETPVEATRIAATPTEFVQWLQGFDTPGALALWLAQHGVTGVPRSSDSCPVARLAQHNLGDPHATVGCCEVYVAGHAPATMPPAACEFVERFDDYAYPELVRHPVRSYLATLANLETLATGKATA